MMKARFRAIMAERARVAHEMHDTLAQSFAGVAFQIQAAKNNSPQGDAILERHLDLALDMVRHGHSEAHRSIVMLRPQSLDETTNLQEALKQSIERMTEGCAINVNFAVNGTQVTCPSLWKTGYIALHRNRLPTRCVTVARIAFGSLLTMVLAWSR